MIVQRIFAAYFVFSVAVDHQKPEIKKHRSLEGRYERCLTRTSDNLGSFGQIELRQLIFMTNASYLHLD
ncbi:hypothetical protein L596_004368 [Steinernema carpocapsae]|uniref:Uncharacterized protein n=1 Tax=Steinernema carpocapsae TaxID=34508 RepID=A0A4V6I841_STECR|nr:hypothetical protein L596_004368 [Steinernema carpocapsae]